MNRFRCVDRQAQGGAPLAQASGDRSPVESTFIIHMQGRCQPIARPMEGGALAPPSPFGAVATAGPSIPSAPLACDKHRGTNGWTIGEACEACIALAYLHSNNYEEANVLHPLVGK